jgi:hypothetical protein
LKPRQSFGSAGSVARHAICSCGKSALMHSRPFALAAMKTQPGIAWSPSNIASTRLTMSASLALNVLGFEDIASYKTANAAITVPRGALPARNTAGARAGLVRVPALATCRLNRATIDRIARRLLRRSVVDGEPLQEILRGAKRLEGIFP